MSKAFLVLADGTVFEGQSIGAKGSSIGETVFTTGMTGYLETLTDPSYFGQIVTQTFPLIGNYGIIPEDYESKKSWVRGYIVRELCDLPSNFRCSGDLDSFLKNQNIIGICGIDTRALTKKLREAGVMNGMIISNSDETPIVNDELLAKIKAYRVEKSVETVSCSKLGIRNAELGIDDGFIKYNSIAKTWPETNHNIFHIKKPVRIVLWDFGAKHNIQRELEKRGAEVIVVPYSYTAEDILKLNPDGIMLSNGPGDPADNVGVIAEIKKMCDAAKEGKVVIFGICLGHQMLALARGAKTSKLKYGHRGGNHPVKDMETGRVYISSQNHGYAVENDTLPSYAKLAFINSNDGTCEGVTYTDIPAFSVQFHPEACGGPHDTNYLFDKFVNMIDVRK
ncbi:MAG: carbamoyl phosphate synthase small subunit [Treponema sp.]|nr:carbamoyl phosphate synthase small subunit [Treponema sp.]